MEVRLDGRAQKVWPLLAWLLPLWCASLPWLVDGNYLAPAFRNPPEAFGLPAGLILLMVAGVLGCLGALAGRASRSRRAAVAAFLFLTVPASLIALATPAVILSIINLSPASG